MLEAITDFWKPMKKGSPQEKLQPELLQIGSTIGFGFVPQAILSGRRLTVSAINTYQFGDEALTSFILTQDKDPGVSMIVAESEGEHYLAISRRIAAGDRMKLFAAADLESAITNPDAARLACQNNVAEYKGWTVASYKREINGLKGRIFKGDFRTTPLPDVTDAQPFEYTLLVSESNEQAIEIEKYNDGRIEVYATVYRRMSDVGEITHPASAKTDIKLAATPANANAPIAATTPAETPKVDETPQLAKAEVPEVKTDVKVETKSEPVKAQEQPAPVPVREEPKLAATAEKPTAVVEKPAAAVTIANPSSSTPINGATNTMSASTDNAMKPNMYMQSNANNNSTKQEGNTVMNNGAMSHFDAEAIECDLRVANKIIDEAIRSEMRLSDVVRRITGLPVEDQGSVQIPVTLTDEDYALLAIRYGISSSDRNSIKRRIIEDLNAFTGGNQKKAA